MTDKKWNNDWQPGPVEAQTLEAFSIFQQRIDALLHLLPLVMHN